MGGSALSACALPIARNLCAGVLMPFDSLTFRSPDLHSLAPTMTLEAAAARAGLKRLDLALLERHKSAEPRDTRLAGRTAITLRCSSPSA